MRTRSISSSSVVALSAALSAAVLAVGGSASAAGDHATEGAGDVSTIDNYGQPLPSGQAVNVDVVRLSVKHAKRAVKIKAAYADLVSPTNGDEITLSTDFKVKGGGRFGFNVGADGGHKALTYFFKSGYPTPCKGMKVSFDYTNNTVAAKVPRKCLGNPGWVRYVARASFDDAAENYFYDLVGTTSGSKSAKYSRKLRVG